MVAQTDLRRRLAFLQLQLVRLHQADKQGPIQEPYVVQNPIPADVAGQRLAYLRDKCGLARGLTGIATAESKDFLEKLLVSLLPSRAKAQIVLNRSLDYGLVQVVRDLGPRPGRLLVRNGIRASLGKGSECPFPQACFGSGCGHCLPPELR
jgi:hypothetical protein